MSRFNETVTSTVNTPNTHNLAGGQAHKQSEKLELVSLLLTSFLADKFYESGGEQLTRLQKLVRSISDKEFAAKAAIFARQKYGMRSVSHVVAGELASLVNGERWLRKFLKDVVSRPDDIMEILSYYMKVHGQKSTYVNPETGKKGRRATQDRVKLTNALKRGLSDALGKFDAYALAKYRGDGKGLSLLDTVNLIHPKPTDKNRKALELLVKDELRSMDTWESRVSEAGQNAETEAEKTELKGEAFGSLITEKKMGYFALIRNINNIVETVTDPNVIEAAIAYLTNRDAVKNSKLLPFRFKTAYDNITVPSGANSRSAMRLRDAVSKAMDIAVENVPDYEGDTLVVLDSSGSMMGKPAEIGSLFVAALFKKNMCDVITFSDDAMYVHNKMNRSDSVLTLAAGIPFRSGGTNFHAIFQRANKKYDRIIILSDMQGWMGYNTPAEDFKRYKQKYNADPFVYSVDLNGHGTMQFPENKVCAIAGWSEKIFDTMKSVETDRMALIHEIEAIDLTPEPIVTVPVAHAPTARVVDDVKAPTSTVKRARPKAKAVVKKATPKVAVKKVSPLKKLVRKTSAKSAKRKK